MTDDPSDDMLNEIKVLWGTILYLISVKWTIVNYPNQIIK